jgi:hypothetical protein
LTYGFILYKRDRAPLTPLNKWKDRLLKANRHKRKSQKANRVDDVFRTTRPVFIGQMSSLQPVGSGEATFLDIIGCK